MQKTKQKRIQRIGILGGMQRGDWIFWKVLYFPYQNYMLRVFDRKLWIVQLWTVQRNLYPLYTRAFYSLVLSTSRNIFNNKLKFTHPPNPQHLPRLICYMYVCMEDNGTYFSMFVCFKFYAVSKVFQLFNGNSSQTHVSWTIFNQYLTNPLSRHYRTSRSAIPIILSAKGKSHYYQFQPFSKQALVFMCLKNKCFEYSRKERNCLQPAISPFSTVFSTCLQNFLPFPSESKICILAELKTLVSLSWGSNP